MVLVCVFGVGVVVGGDVGVGGVGAGGVGEVGDGIGVACVVLVAA